MKFKLFALLMLAFCGSLAAQPLSADLVVRNAKIHTMDRSRPQARSLAVLNGKIVGVGSDKEIASMIGPRTKVIDAGGQTVIPGFNDAHVHFLGIGTQLSSVDLRDARSPEEFVRRIKEFAARTPKGQWILGGNWDHENWTPNDLPTAAMIDAVTPDHPVFIDRLDGHMALANSLAMKLAGVTKATKDVAGGEIVRTADGTPTGVFKDSAMGYIAGVIPELSFDQKINAYKAATEYAASLGVTSVQDMSAGTDIGVLQELLRRGELKTRVYGCSPLGDLSRWSNTGVRAAFGDPMLRAGCLKGFSDGSLGSTTAWFFEPYLDAPQTTGLAVDDPKILAENTQKADAAQSTANSATQAASAANSAATAIFRRSAAPSAARSMRPT